MLGNGLLSRSTKPACKVSFAPTCILWNYFIFSRCEISNNVCIW